MFVPLTGEEFEHINGGQRKVAHSLLLLQWHLDGGRDTPEQQTHKYLEYECIL